MTTRPVNPVTGLDFTPAVGDWLRVKARSDEHGLRARTVREAAPREREQLIESYQRALDQAQARLRELS